MSEEFVRPYERNEDHQHEHVHGYVRRRDQVNCPECHVPNGHDRSCPQWQEVE